MAQLGDSGTGGAVVGWCPKTSGWVVLKIVVISHLYRFGALEIRPCNTVYHVGMSGHHMHYSVNVTVAVCLFDQVKIPDNDVFVLASRRE